MEPFLSPEQLAELRAYRDPQYFWAAVLVPLDFVVMAVVVALSGRIHERCGCFASWLDVRLAALHRLPVLRTIPVVLARVWGGAGWGAAAVFVFGIFTFAVLVHLPADVYFNHVHEHRFGMTNESLPVFLRHWAVDVLVAGVGSAAAGLGLFGLARRTRHWWWLLGVVCACVMFVSAAVDPYRAKLHASQKTLEDGALRERLEALLDRAGVEFDELYVEDNSKRSRRINAYFAGQGRTRRIVLSDNLISGFTQDEVLAVVAHEAGHVRESRVLSFVGAAMALLAFLFLVHWLFLLNVRRGWYASARYGDIRLFPAISLSFLLLSTAFSPISSAFSRQRELDADQFAIGLLGDEAAFRSMLIKAARINRMDPDPPRWLVIKSFSHPPIRDRLAALDAARRNP